MYGPWVHYFNPYSFCYPTWHIMWLCFFISRQVELWLFILFTFVFNTIDLTLVKIRVPKCRNATNSKTNTKPHCRSRCNLVGRSRSTKTPFKHHRFVFGGKRTILESKTKHEGAIEASNIWGIFFQFIFQMSELVHVLIEERVH